MSGVKITDLSATSSVADSDIVVVVDVSTDTTKKVTKANLLSGVGGTPLANIADSGDGVVVSGPLKVGDLTISDDATDAVLSFDSANDATFTGDVTAAVYYGDGSQLTGVSTVSYVESAGDVRDAFFSDSESLIFGPARSWHNDDNDPTGTGGYYARGYRNVNIGEYAGGAWSASDALNLGDYNLNLGKYAGFGNANSQGATNVGYRAGYYSGASKQANLGHGAGMSWTNGGSTDNYSVNVGYYAGQTSTGEHGIFVGYKAGYYQSGSKAIMAGYKAGYDNTGDTSVGIGTYSLKGNTGFRSTAVGDYSGHSNTASGIVAVGPHALYSNTGAYSVGVGGFAGQNNTGAYLSAVGYEAGNGQSGKNVVAVGYRAAKNNTKNYYIEMKSTDSDGRMWFSKDSDWNFGAAVTAPAFVGDGSGLTNLPAGGGLDSAGVLSVFNNETTIKLGDNTTVSGPRTISIGVGSSAASSESMAVGAYASASGIFSVALGRSATTSYEDAIAIGRSATSSQADTIAMGTSAVASNARAVAIGNATDATGNSSIALGNSAQSLGSYAVAIGPSADTNTHSYAVAIGMNTEISGNQGVAIGQNAAAANAGVALGLNSSTVTGTNSTAVGAYAGTTGADALALGRGAKANADNTIVLAATGSNSTVTSQYGIDIRTSDSGSVTYSTDSDWNFGAAVTAPAFIGDGSQLTGISGGSGGLDSAAVQSLIDAEVDATTLVLGAETTAGIKIGKNTSASTLSGGGIAIGSNANATGTQGIAIGIGAEGDNNAIGIGIGAETANSSVSIGRYAVSRTQGTSMGTSSEAVGSAVAFGYSAKGGSTTFGTGDYSVAVGALSNARYNSNIHINANYNSGVGPTAIGGLVIETSAARLEYSADSDWVFSAPVTSSEFKFTDGTSMTTAPTGGGSGGLDSAAVQGVVDDNLLGGGANSIAIGSGVTATSSNATSIGFGSDATNFNSTAVGYNAQASGSETVALGSGSNSVGNTSVAIGYNAKTGGSSQVAIGDGAGSTTDASSHAVMIGPNAGALCGQYSSALGYFSRASGGNAVAIGARTRADGLNSIQISATGVQRIISTQYEIDIRTSDSGSVTYSTDSDWVFGASVNVNGDVNASGDITAFSTAVSSDPRLKENVETLDDAVSKVQQLNGVSWDWVRGGKSAGVISTDVQAVMPEAVIPRKLFGEDTEYDTVNYNALIGLLVEAVKDLQSQIDELKAGE